ncbi:MAG: sigma-70 family RNA polymerase sigma factor [Bryobacterales bacterium]|nr:sigma-70 family RNA polymerase sigma factor [Bryobacterales bacterium]
MSVLNPGEITALLERWRLGDTDSFRRLIPLVYDELHSIARAYMSREGAGHTLQATGLVHEAFLRLAGPVKEDWKDRKHFYGVAARLMRQVLVDHARRRTAEKRQAPAMDASNHAEELEVDYLLLDRALGELEKVHPRRAQIVEFRYFGGLTLEEIASVAGVSISMVAKELKLAQMWLYEQLGGGGR